MNRHRPTQSVPNPAKFRRIIDLLFFAVGPVLALASCNWPFASQPKIYVPVQKTAREQYAYALNFRDKNNLVLHNKEKMGRLLQVRDEVWKTFSAVVENFPEDREVTPLAKLEMARMQAGLDRSRLSTSHAEYRAAVKDFQRLREDYKENEFIQAWSRFGEAFCLKEMKEFESAQKLFKEITENYATSKDKDIMDVVRMAHSYYQQNYVK